jgi:acyl dehydratase
MLAKPEEAKLPDMTTRALTEVDFKAPSDDRWFEDYVAGAVYEYGYVTVDEEEMLDFARKYDPQPIHVDRAFASDGPFGGLIASGWQTGSLFMRLFADHYLSRVASLASPGLGELRWPAPVRAGDRLRARVETTETRQSRSKPDRGLVHTHGRLLNQDDVVVLELTAINMMRCRP